MKGGNVKEFIDKTTYEECAVLYKGIKYFFHGLIFNKDKNVYSYKIDIWDNKGNYVTTVFDKNATTIEECLEIAQNEKIFDGKSFWEAESEMEWVEW